MYRLLAVLFVLTQAGTAYCADRLAVFDEAARITAEQFFDPGMNGVDWDAAVTAHRTAVTPGMEREAVAAEVNALLACLTTSHTRLYTQDDPAWYQLAGVFLHGSEEIAAALAPFLPDGAPIYAGIGVMTEARDDGLFVTGVLQGHPAEAAGVVVGDRLVAVNGAPYHPIQSFAGRVGTEVTLTLERTPGEYRDLVVTPARLDGVTMFEDAMRASARVIEHAGTRVGYVRIWSYAGRKYQDILVGEVLYGRLKEADALVLDLRGGWGGASPEYLTLFPDRAMDMTRIGRDGTAFTVASGWTKPVVLLVDDGSRSGKELIAHGFRALGIGPIVGETTAGAVLAGRLNVLSDGSLLYVAVMDVRVDGARLEGVGVAPDIAVPFDPPFAAGADPQRDRAVEEAVRLAGGG
ncbi:S41 family peptidase [Roseospira marina]|nr:S41 family peptidase [Roseospira marina]MBB4315616.1 carboxyl-terminal processing protease [Roseospira marina]MBB5088612.1 carboxyl-terminal processing protease [Roseospira marina]